MNALSERRKGELHIFVGSVMWAFFPIIVVLSYASVGSLTSLAWSTAIATLFFAGIMTARDRWHEIWSVRLWKDAFMIALFIGVLFYGLYYAGLETSTPGNASIIVLFEVFTSIVFFRVCKGERLSLEYAIGAILMVVGALIILSRGFSGIHIGDLYILMATLFAPAGNFYQQKAREIASSESIMFLRSALSVPPLFILAYVLGENVSFQGIFLSLPFLMINGVLMLGLTKLLWIEGIHRISVTKATALGSIAPFFTLFFAWLILQQAPTIWQLLSLVPFVLGTLLLTDQWTLKRI